MHQKLILRAGISFSECCGSSGAGLELLPSAFSLQDGTFVVGAIVREKFVSPEHHQGAGRNMNETRSML